MKRSHLIAAVALAAVAGAATGTIAAVRGQEPWRTAPAALDDRSASQPKDYGANEDVLLVVGGSFDSRKDAELANAEITFGDLQGFYVAQTDQFIGLREALGSSARNYVLVSAFRTDDGAEEFLALAQAAGAPAFISPRVRNLGMEYVGLGQEENPDGSGPLIGPDDLPNQ